MYLLVSPLNGLSFWVGCMELLPIETPNLNGTKHLKSLLLVSTGRPRCTCVLARVLRQDEPGIVGPHFMISFPHIVNMSI